MQKLLRTLKSFYATQRRDHLPWRNTRDPYKILVSEVMLQQTQVERVIPKYDAFVKAFPTPKALAKAPLSKVLKLWSGLGYNRRAKYLHEAGKKLASAETSREKVLGSPVSRSKRSRARLFSREVSAPLSVDFLESLPGVGPYTARAVAVFAYNRSEIFIETNIRTVFTYFCFPTKKKVADTEILPLVAEALKKSKMQPRDFYTALMDYGSYLKRQGVKLNSKSKHYTKQSKFEGSRRQKNAARLRALLARGASDSELEKALHS